MLWRINCLLTQLEHVVCRGGRLKAAAVLLLHAKVSFGGTLDDRMAEMTFASVYPHYVTKVEKNGRTKQELHAVITWLTGFDNDEIQEAITRELNFEAFFDLAKLNPKADQISGSICGYKIRDITTPLTKQVRYLDKLVDELAKGKALEKVLRQ